MTLPVPCVLDGQRGRYDVTNLLGQGGMSAVYEGRTERGKTVVIKEASGPDITSCEERLRIEAQILSALATPGHPRVVKYLDESSSLGPFCLVEEKVEGPTLAELHRDKAASEKTASRYMLQLLEALDYLHGRNVIHRDVKPTNVILEPNRGVVLIDFGAAKKEFQQFSGSGTIIYTPGWGAPEQNLGEATPASDMYAAGATLFFLLTARDPKSSLRQLPGGGAELFQTPRDLEPRVTQQLSDVVAKAMLFDPKGRFQTAQDMVNAIAGRRAEAPDSPHIVVLGKKRRIKKQVEIGRSHATCDAGCKNGFGRPPDIGIKDSEMYLSKHHARISRDRKGRCWIEDLDSKNGTALSHDGGRTYRPIPGLVKEPLTDGDVVAIVYKSGRGPYMTIAFKGG